MLDEVLRETLQTLIKVFDRYAVGEAADYGDITEYDLNKFFKISPDYYNKNDSTPNTLGQFMHNETALVIFGTADPIELVKNKEALHDYAFDFESDEDNKITLISNQYGRSIGATYYFLGKCGFEIGSYNNYTDLSGIWDDYDVIITANPTVLNTKPTGKVSLKINTPYNNKIKSDYDYNFLYEAFNDEFLKKYR